MSLESKYSLRDEYYGSVEDPDMTVNEEDVAELCKMEIWTVKNIIRLDTSRIGTAFDKMMDAVKRRSSKRHQDVNTAIERCFTAFSGRNNYSISVHQFARSLSVLSMEWSGNFSQEEYLALAQDLSEEDMPGIVTLESFKCAAKNGSVSLSPDNSSRRRRKVDESDDEVGDIRGSSARTARDAEGELTVTERTLETTLQHAASRTRTKGQDVLELLDACIQTPLGEVARDEDRRTLTSEDVAAKTYLSPEGAHDFLSKLEIRVIPSSRGGSLVRTASPAVSSSTPPFAPARSALEDKQKGVQEGQSVKSEAPVPPLPPTQEAHSVSDRYLRALSRDTATIRCRVQFYNQELARTLQETESLASRAAGIHINRGESCEQPSRLSLDIDGSAAAGTGAGGGSGGGGSGGDGGGGGERVAFEVGSGMAAVNSGGGRSPAGMSSTEPVVAFSRVSPVGRADQSHPRMELMSRPGSIPPAPSLPARSGHAQDPGRESESPPKEARSRSGEFKAAVSDRVAKLLLAALHDTKASGPSSSAAALAAVEKKKIAVAPKTACFDPPSIRNGLAGLTASHVDKVLLRVEASTAGAVSSWKSPVSRRRSPPTGGTEIITPPSVGRGLAAESPGRRRRRQEHSQEMSIGWFDDTGTAKGMLPEFGAQGAAGDGPGARRKKEGGGARKKRSMLKIKLPSRTSKTPKTPRTPTKKEGDFGTINRWGIECVEWTNIADDDDDDGQDTREDFARNNPMHARPVKVVEGKASGHGNLPVPFKKRFPFVSRRTRGACSSSPPRSRPTSIPRGPSSCSPSRSVGPSSYR